MEIIKHKREVRDATDYLYHHVIPNFAKKLDAKMDLAGRNASPLTRNIEAIRTMNTFEENENIHLTEIIHREGINVCKKIFPEISKNSNFFFY